ncbi:MAG: T9SS type A sorting domain-containing protein [Bacteroidota bacterium]
MKQYAPLILLVFFVQISLYLNAQTPANYLCPFTAPAANQWPVDGNFYVCNKIAAFTASYNPGGCNSGARDDCYAWFYGDGNLITVTYAPTVNDALIHVWDVSGGCGSLVLMGCADNGGNGVAESVTFASTLGVPYLVRIQRYNSNTAMNGSLRIASVIPGDPGDDCTNPIRFSCGDNLSGESTVGDQNTSTLWSCGSFSYPGEDRFYVVQWPDAVNGGSIRLDFSNVVDADTYFEIFYLGTSCSAGTCSDNAQFDITTQTMTGSALTYWDVDVPAGVQDHYFVIDSQNDGVDSYDLDISCFATGIELDQTNSCGGGTSPCNYSLEMYDSYGDGWNGGHIDLYINTVNSGPYAAAGSGTIVPIGISTGDDIQLDYTSGSWETENSFVFRDGRKLAIHAEAAPPSTGTLYTATATDINCGFDDSNPDRGVYSTWQELDGTGTPIGDEMLCPATYHPSSGGKFRVCENIYLLNPGWEWLKDAVLSVGDCWINVTNYTPNGTDNGFYNWAGDWTASWDGGAREISYTFAHSSNPSWGDGNRNNYTCNLYRFCFEADVDPTCAPVDGFQNGLSVTDDGIGGSGGSTGAANVTVPSTSEIINTLPVELVNFYGKPVTVNDKKMVQLFWLTASEKNNDYFTVERSNDAKHFDPVRNVDGIGNSNAIHEYTAYDENPFNGINYYRLKQTDFDGKFSYSNIITVNLIPDNSIIVFPNPATSTLNISSEMNLSDDISFQLIDITGKIILDQKNTGNNGNNISVMDLSGIDNGVYYLIINSETINYKTKIIKQ